MVLEAPGRNASTILWFGVLCPEHVDDTMILGPPGRTVPTGIRSVDNKIKPLYNMSCEKYEHNTGIGLLPMTDIPEMPSHIKGNNTTLASASFQPRQDPVDHCPYSKYFVI